MTIRCLGDEIEEGDDTSIPVNLSIEKLDEDQLEELREEFEDEDEDDEHEDRENKPLPHRWAKYELTGSYFLPRKRAVTEGDIRYVASTREELQELVKTHILPLYKNAFDTVTAMAEGKCEALYYWDKPELKDNLDAPDDEDEAPEADFEKPDEAPDLDEA